MWSAHTCTFSVFDYTQTHTHTYTTWLPLNWLGGIVVYARCCFCTSHPRFKGRSVLWQVLICLFFFFHSKAVWFVKKNPCGLFFHPTISSFLPSSVNIWIVFWFSISLNSSFCYFKMISSNIWLRYMLALWLSYDTLQRIISLILLYRFYSCDFMVSPQTMHFRSFNRSLWLKGVTEIQEIFFLWVFHYLALL